VRNAFDFSTSPRARRAYCLLDNYRQYDYYRPKLLAHESAKIAGVNLYGSAMPKLNMTVQHRLPQDEAVKRIRGLLESVKTKFSDKVSDVHEEWNGNTGTFSFSALGFPVSGVLTVTPSEVEISGDLPLLAAVYKSKIESTIREQAESLLA
jgi:hypothetical protein